MSLTTVAVVNRRFYSLTNSFRRSPRNVCELVESLSLKGCQRHRDESGSEIKVCRGFSSTERAISHLWRACHTSHRPDFRPRQGSKLGQRESRSCTTRHYCGPHRC